jgi:hypothetical protein
MSVRFYCDGCKRHIEGQELTAAAEQARAIAKSDLFCRTCLEFAPGYWIEQDDLIRRTSEQSMNTLTKHRDRFFADARKKQKPTLEAVK